MDGTVGDTQHTAHSTHAGGQDLRVALCSTLLVLLFSSSPAVTRFTVKLSTPKCDTSFMESNVPCSISSSVSTRGSTLNKLMIAVTFCLGCCLFMKFSQADTAWCQMIGFGYLGLTFTGQSSPR